MGLDGFEFVKYAAPRRGVLEPVFEKMGFGEGILHNAFSCDNLVECWDRLKANGVPFMTAPPDTYYEMLDERLPGHGEPVEELKSRG